MQYIFSLGETLACRNFLSRVQARAPLCKQALRVDDEYNCYLITFAFNRNLPSRGREARVIPLESNIHQVEPPQFGGYHQQQPQQPYQNQKYIPTSSMYLPQRRVGVGSEAELEPNKRFPPDESIISRIQQPPPPQARPYNSPREVSETDLYLLGAIEKLAFRVDYLEKRLKRTEQIVYYLMSGNNQNQQQPLLQESSTSAPASSTTTTKKPAVRDPCPKDFKKVGDVCYHLSSSERVDWKTAAMSCKSYGAILAEFDKVEKFRDVVASILSHKTHRGHDFWIGGLNPGRYITICFYILFRETYACHLISS